MRALARDLGAALGNAAYLGALRRTAAGSFPVADAVSMDTVRVGDRRGSEGLIPLLRPIDEGLERFPGSH